MKTRVLLRNTTLIIVLVVVALLRLLLWPVRVLNKGLMQAAQWTMRRYR